MIEVLLYLYERYGIEGMIKKIDSEAFVFCLYDGERMVFVGFVLCLLELKNREFVIAQSKEYYTDY